MYKMYCPCHKLIMKAIKMYSRTIWKEESNFRGIRESFTKNVMKNRYKLLKVKALVRDSVECYWHKELLQLNSKKKKKKINTMGRESAQTFFQRRHTHGQQAHGKMLTISNQSVIIGDIQIKTVMRIAPVRMAIIKRTRTTKFW